MSWRDRSAYIAAMTRVDKQARLSMDKYGPLTANPHRALAIVVKEMGEVAEAVNKVDRVGALAGEVESLKDELAQVAQLCIQFIMRIEEG